MNNNTDALRELSLRAFNFSDFATIVVVASPALRDFMRAGKFRVNLSVLAEALIAQSDAELINVRNWIATGQASAVRIRSNAPECETSYRLAGAVERYLRKLSEATEDEPYGFVALTPPPNEQSGDTAMKEVLAQLRVA